MREIAFSMTLLWRKRLFYLLLPILIATALFTMRIQTELSAFFVAGDTAEEMLLAGQMQSGALSRRYILALEAPSDHPLALGFIDDFIASCQAIDGIVEIWQAGQQRVAMDALQSLYLKHSTQFYSLQPESELQELFTDSGLQLKAAGLKKALLSPQQALIKKIALEDPLLLTLNSFRSFAGRLRTLVQQDRSVQILILETRAAGLDYTRQKQIQQALQSAFAALNKAQGGGYQMRMTGVPVYAVATQTLIEGDIIKVSILSSVALTLLFLVLFRSFSTLFQVAAILLTVIAVAFLCTQAIFGHIHAMTIAIGTTLIGICIDYPIHGLVHTQAVAAKQRIVVLKGIWPSMMMGGITTVVGYSALGMSGYPGFQQIAVYAGSGILTALLLTRFFLPALLGAAQAKQLKIPAVKFWAQFCNKYRLILVTALLVLIGVSLSGLQSLNWVNDLQQLTPELQYLQENDREIRAKMISTIEPGRFVLVSGNDFEAALQKAEQIYLVLDGLKAQGNLQDYFGLYPWLLSQRQQQRNQRLLLEQFTPPVREAWRQALVAQGLSVERLGNLDYPLAQPLNLQELLDTPLRRLIDNQIIVDDDRALIMIWIGLHDPEVLRNVFEDIPDAHYFSQRDMLNRLAGIYRDRAQQMLIVGVSVILLLLLMRYRSPLKTALTIMPALLAACCILAGWSLSGEAISFLHLVGFLLAIAICVDYGIFYQENCSGDIALTYQAMAASMLTSALAFGSLAIAQTASLRTLALVVAMGVILGFLFCPILIRRVAN